MRKLFPLQTRSTIGLFIALSLTLFGLSCAEVQKFVKTPDLTLQNFQFTHLSLNSIDSVLKVKISNPNSIPIPLGVLNYQLKLLGNDFTKGSIEPTQNLLGGNQTSELTLPFSFSRTEIQKIVSTLGKSKDIPFEVIGDMKIGPFSLPLSKKGTLPKPEVPQFSLEGLKVEKSSLEGMEMSVNLNVSNPNSFPLLLGKFSGNVSLGGSSLASTEGFIANVGANGKSQIKLPFKMKTLDIGSGILNVLSGTKTVSLKGNWVRPSILPGEKEVTETFEKSASLKLNSP